ncbi:unnamed protein product [Rangifer tarandus platyrhynchus]|uniref:Uncharacterized protein n=1 Tax=Rangifer tarandus platyrhynchus TaxID=3082113 RepID=A0AC59YAC8_RANTA
MPLPTPGPLLCASLHSELSSLPSSGHGASSTHLKKLPPQKGPCCPGWPSHLVLLLGCFRYVLTTLKRLCKFTPSVLSRFHPQLQRRRILVCFVLCCDSHTENELNQCLLNKWMHNPMSESRDGVWLLTQGEG